VQTIWPDYYSLFKCIGSSCKHTCCAGWEIDVDEDSLTRFLNNPNVSKHIKDDSIVLGEGERCPFLCNNGLCQMILDYGEDYLCDICKEHPRYYVDCIDHYEGGVGLVCEEACRIILDFDKDFCLTEGYTLPAEISQVFDLGSQLSKQLEGLRPDCMNSSQRSVFFMDMEILDEAWPAMLQKVKDSGITSEEENSVINSNRRSFSNFAAYLLYRQRDAIGFAVESTRLLADLVICGFEIHAAARLFSGEVEYSEENIDKAYDI